MVTSRSPIALQNIRKQFQSIYDLERLL
ncbi:uncharacterized protein METZ01_LOCUS256193, partial [marine metagenome]